MVTALAFAKPIDSNCLRAGIGEDSAAAKLLEQYASLKKAGDLRGCTEALRELQKHLALRNDDSKLFAHAKEVFMPRLNAPGTFIRKHAMDTLLAMESDEKRVDLALFHLARNIPCVRVSAAGALAGSQDPVIRKKLLERVSADANQEVRLACAKALSPASGPEEIDGLIEAATSSFPDNQDYITYVDPLTDYGRGRLTTLLMGSFSHYRKLACMEALKCCPGVSQVQKALELTLSQNTSAEVKQMAFSLLLSDDVSRAQKIVLSESKLWRKIPFLRLQDWELAGAIRASGPLLEDPLLRNKVCSLSYRDSGIGRAALETLAQAKRKDPEIIRRFSTGLRNESTFDLCAHALVDSGSPEAIEALGDFCLNNSGDDWHASRGALLMSGHLSDTQAEKLKRELDVWTRRGYPPRVILLALREQRDPEVQRMAIEEAKQSQTTGNVQALAGIADVEAIDLLLLLETREELAWAVAETLPRPGDGEAFRILVERLSRQ